MALVLRINRGRDKQRLEAAKSEVREEEIGAIHARDEGSLGHDGSRGSGERWTDPRNILKVKPTKFANRSDGEYEEQSG